MGSYIIMYFLKELERKSQVKLNTLLEIEAAVQKQWEAERIFEEDAPQVNVFPLFAFFQRVQLWW